MWVEDEERLRHMLDAAKEAAEFSDGKTRNDLDDDRKLALALVKEIEIIGEAAFRISESTKADLQQIPWPEIVGMRHRLVHAYFQINHDILWDTVKRKLPPLISALEKALTASPDYS